MRTPAPYWRNSPQKKNRQDDNERPIQAIMVRTLAQQLTNEQQNAAGIGQHVDPVKRFVMINVLCVDREDEAEES